MVFSDGGAGGGTGTMRHETVSVTSRHTSERHTD
jgi:hypothetical protein